MFRLPTPRPYSRTGWTGERGNRPQWMRRCGRRCAVPRTGQDPCTPALLLAEVGRDSLDTLLSCQPTGAAFVLTLAGFPLGATLQYLFYRYCIGGRQVQARNFVALRRDSLAHIQNHRRSGEFVTPSLETLQTSG